MIGRKLTLLVGSLLVGLTMSLAGRAATPAVSADEAYAIGLEAYIYVYPLVMMDVTRRVMTNVPPGVKAGMGPMNQLSHMRTYPDANFREVIRPNFDTLYSVGWLDLAQGPVVVTAPDTAGRYYLLPMLDMWTEVFAVPGKRTSGTAAGNFAVVPPGWSGTLPEGVQRIDCPTQYAWIIGRTQTNGPADYDAVHKVQDGYRLTPLASLNKPVQAPPFSPDPSVDMKTEPPRQVNTLPAAKYFAYAADLMRTNPPHVTDWSIIARMKRIGLEPGKSFDAAKLPADVAAALERAAHDGLALMQAKVPTIARVENGWQMNTDTMGVYGNYYLKRAVIAMIALGANLPEDAVYPLLLSDADGKPLVGEQKYVVHFAKGQTPPAGAFWSLTMYDAQGFPVANPISRYAIGDRDPLQFNADGSLDIYIQHDSPGPGKESNWLPAPATGELSVAMRIYAPRLEVLDGRWNPPPVRRQP